MRGMMLAGLLQGIAWVSLLPAEEITIVDQRDYQDSRNACGPASVLNLLKFSQSPYRGIYGDILGATDGVKMRFVVDRYFRHRDSLVYPGQKRWGVHGVAAADLITGLNELLADHEVNQLNASYLDRRDGEPGLDFAHRIRISLETSLDNGVAPILSLRSYVVREQDDAAGEFAWETAVHHNVVVTEVGPFQAESGFRVTALDPWRGKAISIFLYREGAQSFRAIKGVQPTGKWLDGRPFLVAAAPEAVSLVPVNLEWHERFIIVANFLIGDF
ncbi:MAG: hypothetical protein P1U68_13045 [Verrucomicrobiales bacterium]|nr:hypothetical protein [Verrucomicrobiales bacterium]